MKKLLSSTLLLALLMALVFTLASCALFRFDITEEIVGTYEMVGISGTMSYNGQTVNLDEDLYEYYRIIIREDGSCIVKSKGTSSSSVFESAGTWEYNEGVLEIKTSQSGVTVVEEMKWEDGVITYDAKTSSSGITISMHLVLEKVEKQ